MKNRNLLYQNKVYSTNVDLFDIQFGDDFSIIYRNQSTRDEDLHEDIFDKNGNPKEFPFAQSSKLFLFDEPETRIRNSYLKMIRTKKLDLSFSKEIIADDHYPVYVDYFRPFKRMTAQRKTAIMLGEYQLTFGRICLVEMISICRYEPAWPEIREIILHDDNMKMKHIAQDALLTFPPKIVIPIICDALDCLTGETLIKKFLRMVDDFPSGELVPCLENLFERHYHYYPGKKEELFELYYNSTILHHILRACENIPSLQALSLLEEGFKHPYGHVEQQAFSSIKKWVKNTSEHIASKSESHNHGLVKAINEVAWKYDINLYHKSVDQFKKRYYMGER